MLKDSQTLTSFILFTDIYRSSSLWERSPERFSRALEAHGGGTMKNLGDGYLALFPAASSIVAAMQPDELSEHAASALERLQATNSC